MTQTNTDVPNGGSPRLASLRALIDAVDEELLGLLVERGRLVDQVAALKRSEDLPIHMPEREQAILDRVRVRAEEAGLSADIVEEIFRAVLAESHRRMGAE